MHGGPPAGRERKPRRHAPPGALLQIVQAVHGSPSPYECREIRQQGRGALPAEECQSTCVIAAKKAEAQEAWRGSLAGTSLADMIATGPFGPGPTAPARTGTA
ncbi:hypothetical protein [Streptomyces sp. NPDC048350]|uniref:hypothetical protein n=1 Tax=Streptomyces sp. NPDC048350 TaxID=3365538 RepID=UPI0037238C80